MMIKVKVVLAFIFLLLGSGVTATWASPGHGGGFHGGGFHGGGFHGGGFHGGGFHGGGFHGGGFHGGGFHGGGVIIDSPLFWWPSYYAYPYDYSYFDTLPASPAVYLEQPVDAPGGPPPPDTNYWYYCADSQAYYPYVSECPSGWQRVAPQPPPAP
jgi:hypothetical protein